MSLVVKHLNADATFLLTFAPASALLDTRQKLPGSFAVLLDPWLDGDSIIYHRKFAHSRHVTPPAINTLAELEDEIDLIIISQDKADHLSKETICTLSKDTSVRILATAKAAKKIRGWKHFQNPGIVQEMEPYQDGKHDNIIRIPIEPDPSASADGGVTIANITEQRDITGVHNAIAITYRPPGTIATSWDLPAIKLESMAMRRDTEPKSASSSSSSSEQQNSSNEASATPPTFSILEDSPIRIHFPLTSESDSSNTDNGPILSALYTPHGLSVHALKPYLRNHPTPITALFHSLNRETNPWWLGGVVSRGAPGGAEIAREVGARVWIGAHDGTKELSGWATRRTRTRRFGTEEVRGMLQGRGTEIWNMGCGEVRRIV